MKRIFHAVCIAAALYCLAGWPAPASGAMYDIVSIPELPDWPRGVNDYGVRVGMVDSPNPVDPEIGGPHGVLRYPDGSVEHLYTLYGDDLQVTDLNNALHVVGTADYMHTIDEGQAFIWEAETGMTWLGSLAGTHTHFSVANAINNLDQIVGYSWTADFEDEAFYWDDASGMLNLNDLIPADSGWYLTEAWNINDLGQIAGDGLYLGVPSEFLLTPLDSSAPAPVPEPHTCLLMATGAWLVLQKAGRRRRRPE